VLRAADQWAAEPATVEDVLDAQNWARDRAKRAVERENRATGLMSSEEGLVTK
jgi:1-deoxy-D-xylulose-5-phosphate reductoisomerase